MNVERRMSDPERASDAVLQRQLDQVLLIETYNESPIIKLTLAPETLAEFLSRVEQAGRELPVAMYDGRRAGHYSLFVFLTRKHSAKDLRAVLEAVDVGAHQVVLIAEDEQHALGLIDWAEELKSSGRRIVRRWPGESEVEYPLPLPESAESAAEVDAESERPKLSVVSAA